MSIHYQDDKTTIHHGDCLEVLRTLPDESVHAVVTDPPYGLSNTTPEQVAQCLKEWATGNTTFVPAKRGGFMGKDWDSFVPPPAVWEECYRVLKPGGHLLAFAGSRTQDLMGMSVRMAGFEMRDSIAWLYGAGFPKSLDVSKAIDKAAGAEREVTGRTVTPFKVDGAASRGTALEGSVNGDFSKQVDENGYRYTEHTSAATAGAQQWEGWGTALKPAFEPVVVARKPLIGTVAANVLEHGTGAINVDGCRVGTGEDRASGGTSGAIKLPNAYGVRAGGIERPTGGRWPANVVLDESQAEALDAQAGDRPSGKKAPHTYKESSTKTVSSFVQGMAGKTRNYYAEADTGGASRFFYVARKDNECPSGQSSSTVSTAEMSSSGEGQAPDSAPSDAATSERHDTGKQMGSLSTNGTQNGSKPSATTDTPTTPTIESASSPERQRESATPSSSPANSAEPNPQTDTTTTTTSHLTSDGSAESATSSTTQKSKELGDMDLGDSSRFMYVAKAPKRERPNVDGTAHPTVKPLSLMRWLVRLVTPPGGTVLDPFAGSGTTIEAALTEGFNSIGIELTDEYLPLIEHRIRRSTETAMF